MISNGHYQWNQSVQFIVQGVEKVIEIVPTVIAGSHSIIVCVVATDDNDIRVVIDKILCDFHSFLGHTNVTAHGES